MSNIRSIGSPSGMPPSPTPTRQISDQEAAEALLDLRSPTRERAPAAQTSSPEADTATTTAGRHDFRGASAAGRSTQRRLIESLASDDDLRHKGNTNPGSQNSPGDAAAAHASTPREAIQIGRRLGIADLLAENKATPAAGSAGNPPFPTSGLHRTAATGPSDSGTGELEPTTSTPRLIRAPSPGSSRIAHDLHQAYRASQTPEAVDAPLPGPTALDKGKGKAPVRSPSAELTELTELYHTGEKRRRSGSPEAPPEKRLNIGSTPTAEEGTTSAAATPSSQSHPYLQITPGPRVATRLEGSTSLTQIWTEFVPSSLIQAQGKLQNFERYLQSKGITNTEALSSYHRFMSLTNDYLNDEEFNKTTEDHPVLRKLAANVFPLPSKTQLEKIASMIDFGDAKKADNNRKLLTDAAIRLDELAASMPVNGSIYEGTDAQKNFMTLMHAIIKKGPSNKIFADVQVIKLLHLFRAKLYSLPLDDALNSILEKAISKMSSNLASTYRITKLRMVNTLAEIAFNHDISEEEMLYALTEWKNAKTYLLDKSEPGRRKKVKTDNFTSELDDRKKEVFRIINKELDELEPGLGSNANMFAISTRLKNAADAEQEPVAQSDSTTIS